MDIYQSPKIIFPHIMKTGGTTVNNYLQNFFHQNEVLYDASVWDELKTVSFEHIEKARFVRGHFEQTITDFFGPHNGFEIIGLLRNPVQRVISHYWHLMKAPDIDPAYNFIRERNLSVEEFVNSPECAFIASNYQVSMYGAGQPVGAETPPDTDSLRKAKEHIDRCCVVGVTEELDGFIHNLAEHFGFASTPPELGKNRSYRSQMDLSDELVNTIERMNALDLELYDYVLHRISEQKIKPKQKITPLGIDESGFLRWNADEPFSGTGWGDLQRAEPVHRWSLSPTATLDITRNYHGSMLGFLAIERFVADEQEDSLCVYINNDKVKLQRVQLDGSKGQHYFFQVPPSPEKAMELRFELEHLIAFSQIDPNATSHMPRGLALIGIGFDPFD